MLRTLSVPGGMVGLFFFSLVDTTRVLSFRAFGHCLSGSALVFVLPLSKTLSLRVLAQRLSAMVVVMVATGSPVPFLFVSLLVIPVPQSYLEKVFCGFGRERTNHRKPLRIEMRVLALRVGAGLVS